jgi:hypothetical protein
MPWRRRAAPDALVYLLQSESFSDQRYVGMALDVKVCGRRPRARGATFMGPASENLQVRGVSGGHSRRGL